MAVNINWTIDSSLIKKDGQGTHSFTTKNGDLIIKHNDEIVEHPLGLKLKTVSQFLNCVKKGKVYI